MKQDFCDFVTHFFTKWENHMNINNQNNPVILDIQTLLNQMNMCKKELILCNEKLKELNQNNIVLLTENKELKLKLENLNDVKTIKLNTEKLINMIK